jgi:hypothetical protein
MGNNTWRETLSVVYTYNHETSLPEKISAQPLFWSDDSDKALTSLLCPANLNGSYKTASELEISYIRQIKTANQDSVNHKIYVYPNPSPTGIFYIDGKDERIESYAIYNMAGQIIAGNSNPNGVIINLSEQPRGIYIIRILHTGGVQSLKLIRN